NAVIEADGARVMEPDIPGALSLLKCLARRQEQTAGFMLLCWTGAPAGKTCDKYTKERQRVVLCSAPHICSSCCRALTRETPCERGVVAGLIGIAIVYPHDHAVTRLNRVECLLKGILDPFLPVGQSAGCQDFEGQAGPLRLPNHFVHP